MPSLHAGSVQLKHLNLIKWKSETGEMHRFYLMENISFKWRDIGELIGISYHELHFIAQEHRDKPIECCRTVLGHWLESPPPDYPTTWGGLIELLEDSQLDQMVAELRTVLSKSNKSIW